LIFTTDCPILAHAIVRAADLSGRTPVERQEIAVPHRQGSR